MRFLIASLLLVSASTFAADDPLQPCFGPGPCVGTDPLVAESRHIEELDCSWVDDIAIDVRIYNPKGQTLVGGRGVSLEDQCRAVECAIVYGAGCP
jgi:hypothetical protein